VQAFQRDGKYPRGENVAAILQSLQSLHKYCSALHAVNCT